MFTDESRFTLYQHDGRQLVRRRQGEVMVEQCVDANHGRRVPSIMVWGTMHHGGKSDLVVVDGNLAQMQYIDILRDTCLPFARAVFRDNFVLVQDNAPAHRAHRTRYFLAQEQVEVMDWPPCSPDMNPIEHLWDQMGKKLRRIEVLPRNLVELRAAVLQAWDQVDDERLGRLVDSMPRRVRALRNARGGNTRY